MNLSGKAVRYWMDAEKIPVERVVVITDDLNLPFGTLRLRAKGSDGGHNGLKDIQAVLLGVDGIPSVEIWEWCGVWERSTGRHVLGKWSSEEQERDGRALDQGRRRRLGHHHCGAREGDEHLQRSVNAQASS